VRSYRKPYTWIEDIHGKTLSRRRNFTFHSITQTVLSHGKYSLQNDNINIYKNIIATISSPFNLSGLWSKFQKYLRNDKKICNLCISGKNNST